MRRDRQTLTANAGRWPAIVAVVGMGKIGLPLAVQFAQHGCRVIGCDINPRVVDTINGGQPHFLEEPGLAAAVASAVAGGTLSATLETCEAVRQADVVVVIVPVVIDAQHKVDFAAIDAATAAIGAGLQPGTLVIYETTLPVGTTSRRLRRLLEDTARLQAGRDFFLAYSPERVSSGRIFRDLRTYPKIVGGIDEDSTRAVVEFYRSVLEADIMPMASMDEAEFVKLIETTYRDVNIALANEYACFADAHGLDVSAAIVAANTQPYSHIHAPGVGVGGHCIPVYPYFLFAEGEECAPSAPVSELPVLTLPRSARRINDSMAHYAVRRVESIVGALARQPVLLLGVAYRGGVRETAFTSAYLLQSALMKKEAVVYVDDPLFSEEELRSLGYTPLVAGREGKIRAIIVQADHPAYQEYDFARFSDCRVLLDGRRVLSRERIEALGMCYIAIGDGSLAKLERESGQKTQVPTMFVTGGQH